MFRKLKYKFSIYSVIIFVIPVTCGVSTISWSINCPQFILIRVLKLSLTSVSEALAKTALLNSLGLGRTSPGMTLILGVSTTNNSHRLHVIHSIQLIRFFPRFYFDNRRPKEASTNNIIYKKRNCHAVIIEYTEKYIKDLDWCKINL